MNPTVRTRKVVRGKELEDGLKAGATDIYAVAIACYGQGSGLCAIEKEIGNPTLSRDGVKNFKKLNSSDAVKQTAIGIIRDASEATNAYVGDGTTTTVILACAFIDAGKIIPEGDVEKWVAALSDNASHKESEVKTAVQTACQDDSMANVALATAEATQVAVVRADEDGARMLGGTFLARKGGDIYEEDKYIVPLAGVWGDKTKLDKLIANLVEAKITSGVIFGECVDITGYLAQLRAKGIANFELVVMSAKQAEDIFSKQMCLPNPELDRDIIMKPIISTTESMVINGIGSQVVGLVGLRANTTSEFEERQLRFDDARQTAYHAQNGTVKGAGIAYKDIAGDNEALLSPWYALGQHESTDAIDTLDCVVTALRNAVTASNHLLQTKVALIYDKGEKI